MNVVKVPTKIIRRILVGGEQEFVFRRVDTEHGLIPEVNRTNIYVHIPFCKSLCPYCPYNRVRYDAVEAESYIEAMSKEIELYAAEIGRVEVSSIYIGGGTPTNLIDGLGRVLEEIRDRFDVVGDIAIETTVADITVDNIRKLKEYGVNVLSVGVQSFNDKYLKLLGRNYRAKQIEPAMELLSSVKFDTVNIDMMFAYPGQTKRELEFDITKAKQLDVDEITTYPLFTFPYSEIGEYLKIHNTRMPRLSTRREFYNTIYESMINDGYDMSSVWSFKRRSHRCNSYSSVTRESYIGFGAGAGSKFKYLFYFNTFSIPEYIKRLSSERLPIAVSMPLSSRLSNYYWFYWKLYETVINKSDLAMMGDRKTRALVSLLAITGFFRRKEKTYELTEKGAFWIHLAQNYFLLDYINEVWGVMKKEAYPEEIAI